MSVQLLDKTRKINKLLHNNNTSKVVFNDICEVLSEILESNILVLSKKGKVLGFSVWKDVDVINELMENNIGSFQRASVKRTFHKRECQFGYTWILSGKR